MSNSNYLFQTANQTHFYKKIVTLQLPQNVFDYASTSVGHIDH